MKKVLKYYKYIILIIFISFFNPYIESSLNGTINNPLDITRLENLGFPINSSGDDFSPSITADEKTMIFNSKLKNDYGHNIYISRKKDGVWSTPKYFFKLNSKYDNDETPFISPDGTLILFSSDREGSLRPAPTAGNRERITFDIYYSKLEKGIWTEPERIPGEVNSEHNERSPSLSKDKKTIYFTRWPFKNIRKSLIMRATLVDGKYVQAKELPVPINTGNYEIGLTPSYSRNGFYFSSRRPKGFGGWDIYFVQYNKGRFSNVVNLGPEINSGSNELFLSEVNGKIYFCTNREGGHGRYDIFYAKINRINIKVIEDEKEDKLEKKADTKKVFPPIEDETKKIEKVEKKEDTPEKKYVKKDIPVKFDTKTELKFDVVRKEIPVSVRFKIYYKKTEDPKSKVISSRIKWSNKYGKFSLKPVPGAKWLIIKIAHRGYKKFRKAVKIEQGEVQNIKLKLIPLKIKKTVKRKSTIINKRFIFKPIYFTFNSAKIKLNYYPVIHRLINHLRKNEELLLEIIGHSDLYGTNERNDEISFKRAVAVRDYLVKLGLKNERFTIKGLGNKHPSVTFGRRRLSYLNRRVEFRIIEK